MRYGLHEEKYAWSGGRAVDSFLTTIVKLTADDGITGFGEVCPLGSAYMDAFAGGLTAGVVKLAPALLGQDPTNIRGINTIMDAALGGHTYIKSPP